MAKTKELLSAQQVLWFMVLWGFAVNYMIRVNINIAIVAMAQRPRQSMSPGKPAFCAASQFTTSNVTVTSSSYENLAPSNVTEAPASQGAGAVMNEYEQGLVLGAFFWLYWVTQLPGGMAASRFGTKLVFGVANALPGVLGMLIPVAASYGVWHLVAIRLIQGLVAGCTWPSMHHLTAQWIEPDRRSKFVTAYLGSSVGAALTFPACGSLMAWAGWPAVFYASGAVSILWAVAWWLLVFDSPAEHPRISPAERAAIQESLRHELASKGSSNASKRLPTPWKDIVTSMPLWINVCSQWGAIWGLFTVLTQAPTYFRHIHGWGIHMTGVLSGLPHLCRIISALAVSHVGDWLLQTKRMSRTNVRKSATAICNLGMGIFILAVAYSGCNSTLAAVALVLATALNGAVSTGALASLVDISPNFASIVMGVCSAVTVFPGFVSPYIVGLLTLNNQTTEQWKLVFLIAGLMSIVTGVLYIIFADSQVQPWNSPKEIPDKELQLIINGKNAHEPEYDRTIKVDKVPTSKNP